MSTVERQNARAQAADIVRTRGTSRTPQAPISLAAQPGPQNLLVTWDYPPVNSDIQKWRVYKNDENTLFTEISDRGNRQCVVFGTNAVPLNVFVSSVNAFGMESPKAFVQGTPSAATAAVPGVPSGYNSVASGGGNRSGGTGGGRNGPNSN